MAGKAKWIDEVVDVVSSDKFADWLTGVHRARKNLKESVERYEELLTQVNLVEFRAELAHRNAIDTLERANRLEDSSARLANEAAVLENDSFEVVSQYEMQRDRTTKLWEQMGGIDLLLEEAGSDRDRAKHTKQRTKISESYEREDQRKQRLWADVERLWVRGIDCNLALVELRHKSKLEHKVAEALFLAYENESQQAAALKSEADKKSLDRDRSEEELAERMERARTEFLCLLNEDFLYWVARENNKTVYAVPLIDDAENYTVPVAAGQVYQCDAQRGVETLVLLDPETITVERPKDR